MLLATDDLECFSYERGFFPMPVDWQEKLAEVDDVRPIVATGCIKLIARTDGTTAADLIRLLEAEVGEVGHVTTSGLDWVDVGPPASRRRTPSSGCATGSEYDLSEVVAVGDNHNDLSVLAWAGQAMAPANTIPEVLAMVDRVLPSNAEEGVAVLLEELAAGS